MEADTNMSQEESKQKYLFWILFDIAFGIGVVLGILGGDETGPYAMLALAGYGVIVIVLNKKIRSLFNFKSLGKSNDIGGLIANLFVLLLLLAIIGAIAPVIHLIDSLVKFFRASD